MTAFRFCDEELAGAGFSWIADEAMTRTSHALVSDGRVWLVDPLDWPEAIERARSLGEPAGVVQLLDRHERDCAALAERLRVPHHVVPAAVDESPFECITVVRRRWWKEAAVWWPEAGVLVVAEALGTNAFFTGGKAPVGVHLLVRLTPPRQLAREDVRHLLVGHGEGVHGPEAASEVGRALAESRRRLPGVLVRLPFAGRS